MTAVQCSQVVQVLRTTLIPLTLMLLSPLGVQFVWVVCFHYDGSLLRAISEGRALPSLFPSITYSGVFLGTFFLWMQLMLLLLLPAKKFVAGATPMGNKPEYRLNGVLAFVITHILLLALHFAGLWKYQYVYDHFGELLTFLNTFALLATPMLYIRGLYFPTTSDSGKTANGFVWDLWQGTELHPEIFGVSLKQLINCRFAMMGWGVLVVSFTFKQKEVYGFVSNSMVVSTALQLIYIFKFFWWESGYFNSVRCSSLWTLFVDTVGTTTLHLDCSGGF